jgi:DNA-binding GntR family transcriptional regulator
MAELFEIREWLETKAAKKMAEQLSEADTVFFNRLISETERAVTKNDESRFLECEENFHDYIIRRCGNRHLLSVMEGMNDLIHRERLLSVKSRENIELTLVEHKRIVNAICKKDPEEAASMMSDHIRSAGQRLCKRLSQIIQI